MKKTSHEAGDRVFFAMSNGTVTGEGMALGYAVGKVDDVVILLAEGSVAHIPPSDCSPLGTSHEAKGRVARAANPGGLKP